MNSEDKLIKEYGLIKWIPWKSCFDFLPGEIGIYIFRFCQSFGRLKGSSDILYIGSSTDQKGLKNRLKFYIKPGSSQLTSLRIHALLKMNDYDNVEIAFSTFCDNDPKKIESLLLEEYVNVHHELPPWNRKI